MFALRRLPWLRPAAALAGAALLVGGAVALFTLDNSAGSLFLLTLGVVLLLVAVLGRRIQLESFELLGAKVKVQDVVRGRLQLAERTGVAREEQGDRGARDQARALQTLGGLYDLYAYIRRTEPPSRERTAALDELARRMQAAGREAEFDPADVSNWFHHGDDSLRIVALNLMLAREECRDFLAVLSAINEPRSGFEQFYGMGLGRVMLGSLDPFERRLLADALGRARRKRGFRRDGARMRLSDSILAELDV